MPFDYLMHSLEHLADKEIDVETLLP
ncbi:hypothetical protein [Thalassomonas actiniarum]|uniref:Uncharacterized protein n=1 Tax=Thalassomonas actiniarum TaxID=485447 RepID=A0AAE9YWA3_9GAMM|nr:hypothetical protein SG35_026575 [Thalassomonas actiniarum]